MGVMGKSLALNLAENGFGVAVYNRHLPGSEEYIASRFVEANTEFPALQGFDELASFLNTLQPPRNILLMIKAGAPVDAQLEELLPFLGKDDLIMDGGNSHFKDTARRVEWMHEQDMHYLGIGISGGEEGARFGPSVMPGGSHVAYRRVSHFLEALSATDKQGKPCSTYIGPGGAGHFVKMMHNGIEYAEMQLIAEAYDLLRNYAMLSPHRIAALLEEWNDGELESYLLGITIDILRKKKDGNYLIDKVLDQSKQKGTGGWSSIASIELGMPADTISAAVMARFISSFKTTRQRAENRYGFQHKRLEYDTDRFINRLGRAYAGFRIINHAIGFSVLWEASQNYEWNLDLPEIARIWTNGCIIRSGLMEQLSNDLGGLEGRSLLEHPAIVQKLQGYSTAMRHMCAEALQHGFSVPVSSAALNYFLGFTSGQLPANLIQAQRDYFGAHTYQRTDRSQDETFHTNWKPDSHD